MFKRYNLSNRKKLSIVCYIIACLFLITTYIKVTNILSNNGEYQPTGHKAVIVISGSMEPAIAVNSISILEYCGFDSINIGDVIMYDIPNSLSITHRVIDKVDKNNERYFITKGDANPTKDNIKITPDMVQGKLIKTYNWVAPILTSIMSAPGVVNPMAVTQALMFVAVFFALLITILFQIIKQIYVLIVSASFKKGNKFNSLLAEYKDIIEQRNSDYNDIVSICKYIEDTNDTLPFKLKIRYIWARAKILKELKGWVESNRDLDKAMKIYDNRLVDIKLYRLISKIEERNKQNKYKEDN